MKNKISNRTSAKIFVDLLIRNGCRNACIAPGSRNLPLTEALIKSPIKCYSYIDERSMCYFALGLAKSLNEPVAIVTTSGTATANLLPGITEAKISNIPLIAITADRPKRLISTGTPQTITQNNMFGSFVNKAIDIKDCGSKSIKKIYKCLEKSYKNSPGPVHINFRFEEPIYDDYNNLDYNMPEASFKSIEINKRLVLENFKRPMIICGGINPNAKTNQIAALAKKINAPILADVFSQMRHNSNKNGLIYYQQYINKLNPDLILRFGYKPVSKALNDFLDKNKR